MGIGAASLAAPPMACMPAQSLTDRSVMRCSERPAAVGSR